MNSTYAALAPVAAAAIGIGSRPSGVEVVLLPQLAGVVSPGTARRKTCHQYLRRSFRRMKPAATPATLERAGAPAER